MTTKLSIAHFLHPVDVLIVIFFIGLFVIVPKLIRRTATTNDAEYLAMGRGLSLPLFIATLTSTWYGGILGVTQIAFHKGIYSFVCQGLCWYVAYIFFALFLAKKIRKHHVLSLPELIGNRYGHKARQFSAALLFFHALPITYALSIGIVLEISLNLDFLWALILGVSIVTLYTAKGGLRGVVITDAVQFVLMFSAVILVIVFSYEKIGDITHLKNSLPISYFTLEKFRVNKAIIWLFIACTTTFIHPVFFQRCLAAKSDFTAQMGIFSAIGFWIIFDICTCLGGMYAKVLLPEADSATAYLFLAMEILPIGFKGIFLAGIVATILSTLDSFLLVAGCAISYDLFGAKNKPYAHHIAILACGIVVIIIAHIFGKNFEATWFFLEGAFSTSLLCTALAALFIKSPLKQAHFFIPVVGAGLVFLATSILYYHHLITLEPFYCAHGVGFLLLATALYTERQRHTKIARFADG